MKIKVTYDLKDINLREEVEDTLAKTLQEEIDAEVLRSVFKESGWREVVLRPMTWEHGDQIDIWVAENIKGGHWNRGLVWLFKDEKEANWFSLRWLGSQQ